LRKLAVKVLMAVMADVFDYLTNIQPLRVLVKYLSDYFQIIFQKGTSPSAT